MEVVLWLWLEGLVVGAMLLVMLRIKQGPWVLSWKLRGLFLAAAGSLFAVAARYLAWLVWGC